MAPPQLPRVQIVHHLLRIVIDHPDLFNDNLPLLVDIAGRQTRMDHQIAQQVDGVGQVFAQHGGVERCLLACGEGIQLASEPVDLLGNVASAAMRGAFEAEVLEKMGQPGFLRLFVAGSHLAPDANGDGLRLGHRLRQDLEAVGEPPVAERP
jgi:hypothetical protein